jgi:hypothetical protein
MTTPVAYVIYNSRRLIPAPQVQISRMARRTQDGTIVGWENKAILRGKLVACKGWDFGGGSGTPELYSSGGYPTDDSDCCKFQNLLDMQEKVQAHFRREQDYKWFEIQNPPNAAKKWLARVENIEFAEGKWIDWIDYTITLDLQSTPGDSDYEELYDNLIEFNETWDVSFSEEQGGVYNLRHTLSCSSKEFANSATDVDDGWIKSKEWLESRLAGSSTGMLNTSKYTDYTGGIKEDLIFENTGFSLANYTPYDYTVEKGIDELAGRYNISETWKLAKDPIYRTWSVDCQRARNGDSTIRVNGSFTGFLYNRNGEIDLTTQSGNYNLVKTVFDAWESGNGPYLIASGYYDDYVGFETLNSCPTSRSVTIVEESRESASGTTTDLTTNKTRIINFSFEFTDGGDNLYDISTNISSDISYIGKCTHNASIDGSIKGNKCPGNTDSLVNAVAGYATLNFPALASGIYGTGNFHQISSRYVTNEREGTVSFGNTYSSDYINGFNKNESRSESWSCQSRGSDGEPVTIISIQGSIEAVCDKTWEEILAEVPNPTGYGISGYLTDSNLTKDEIGKKISYDYKWNSDSGLAKVDVVVNTRNGPDRCDITYYTVTLKIVGNGCTDAIASGNAATVFATLNPLDYISMPAGCSQTSYTKSVTSNGTIDATYEYSTLCEAETSITITENYDMNDCGIKKTQISGNIKGRCGISGKTALETAEDAFDNIDISAICDGYIISHSISKNEREGTLTFNYECHDRPKNYIDEQTVTVSYDDTEGCYSVRIEGTITPLCPASGAAVAVGESGWLEVSGALSGIAAASVECGESQSLWLRRSSISRDTVHGKRNYSYDYTCCKCVSIPGALEENVEISNNHQTDVVAIIPILGRAAGPIIQDKLTKTVDKCNINISLKYPPVCNSYAKPSGLVDGVSGILVDAMCCTGNKTYIESDNESWSPRTGRYTRQITYICEHC